MSCGSPSMVRPTVFSFGCQFNAQTFRLYYRFTETPADLSREMLVYYLQLNDDFTQFQLFLDPSNRLYLGFEMPAAVLTAPFLKWVLNDYTSYCDQLYEDLSTAT